MLRQFTALTLAVALFSAGCTMEQTDRPVTDYYGSGRVPLGTAPFKGDYILYEIPKQGGYQEVYRTPLAPPQKIGFITAADGTFAAVAGEKTLPLQQGFYSWHGTPGPGQYDAAKTQGGIFTTVLVIVGVGVVVAGIAAL